MPEHYFTASPTSPHAQRAVTLTALGVKMRLVTDAGVFSREGLDAGTRILLEALPPLAGRVLDLGCGWGALGLTLAKRYPEAQFVLTDLNERACQLSKRNAEANRPGQNVRVLCGDGFEPGAGRVRLDLHQSAHPRGQARDLRPVCPGGGASAAGRAAGNRDAQAAGRGLGAAVP